MILSLAILIPLLLAAVYVYVRFRPDVDVSRRVALRTFDGAVLLSVVLVGLGVTSHFETTTRQSSDRAWWPILAVLACLFTTPMVLFVAALIRKTVFGKKR